MQTIRCAQRQEHRHDFGRHCAHLRRHYHPVPLRRVAQAYQSGIPLPPNAVAATLDDGCLNVFHAPYLILIRYMLPATVYPITDFLDWKTGPRWDIVSYLFTRQPHEFVRCFLVLVDGTA